MADTNEHLGKLYVARGVAVAGRREVASDLAEGYREGHTEQMRKLFIDIQNTVEAIDRAIEDEQHLEAGTNQATDR